MLKIEENGGNERIFYNYHLSIRSILWICNLAVLSWTVFLLILAGLTHAFAFSQWSKASFMYLTIGWQLADYWPGKGRTRPYVTHDIAD